MMCIGIFSALKVNESNYQGAFEQAQAHIDNGEEDGNIIIVQDIELNYYATDNVSAFSDEIIFMDLTFREKYRYSELKPIEKRKEYSLPKQEISKILVYGYQIILLMFSKDSYSCIPTSTIIVVKCLYNMGFLTLDGSIYNSINERNYEVT